MGATGPGSWRLTFYFMGACGAASLVSFLFFKETFRTERSLAWQKARKTALEKAAAGDSDEVQAPPSMLSRWAKAVACAMRRCKPHRGRSAPPPTTALAPTGPPSAPFQPPDYLGAGQAVERLSSAPISGANAKEEPVHRATSAWTAGGKSPALVRKVTTRRSINRVVTAQGREIKVRGARSVRSRSTPLTSLSTSFDRRCQTFRRWDLPLRCSSSRTTSPRSPTLV